MERVEKVNFCPQLKHRFHSPIFAKITIIR